MIRSVILMYGRSNQLSEHYLHVLKVKHAFSLYLSLLRWTPLVFFVCLEQCVLVPVRQLMLSFYYIDSCPTTPIELISVLNPQPSDSSRYETIFNSHCYLPLTLLPFSSSSCFIVVASPTLGEILFLRCRERFIRHHVLLLCCRLL